MQILAFLDTNMLISPTRIFALGGGGLTQGEAPTPVVLRDSGI